MHSRVLLVLCCAADEQARLGALRAQLGALEQERAGDFEARVKGMQDLSAALQVGRRSCLYRRLLQRCLHQHQHNWRLTHTSANQCCCCCQGCPEIFILTPRVDYVACRLSSKHGWRPRWSSTAKRRRWPAWKQRCSSSAQPSTRYAEFRNAQQNC